MNNVKSAEELLAQHKGISMELIKDPCFEDEIKFIQQRDAEVWQAAMERAAEICKNRRDVYSDPLRIRIAEDLMNVILAAKNDLPKQQAKEHIR